MENNVTFRDVILEICETYSYSYEEGKDMYIGNFLWVTLPSKFLLHFGMQLQLLGRDAGLDTSLERLMDDADGHRQIVFGDRVHVCFELDGMQ